MIGGGAATGKWPNTSEPMSSRMSSGAVIVRPSSGPSASDASSMSSGLIPSTTELPSNCVSPRRWLSSPRGTTSSCPSPNRTTTRPLWRISSASARSHRRRADELGDKEVDGRVVEHLRGSELLQDTSVEHGDPVAERHRLGLVVRHVHRGHPEVALDARDLGAHLDAQLRVEIRQRFVHQERLGLTNDRASHRDPLALPAGERPRLLLEHLVQSQHSGGIPDPPVDLLALDVAHLQSKRNVGVRRHVRVEGVVLEDHRDVAVLRWQVVDHAVAHPDLPARDVLEPGDHPEGGRLATAGGADEHDELAVPDLQIEAADSLGAVPVDLRQTLQLDLRHTAANHMTHSLRSCDLCPGEQSCNGCGTAGDATSWSSAACSRRS